MIHQPPCLTEKKKEVDISCSNDILVNVSVSSFFFCLVLSPSSLHFSLPSSLAPAFLMIPRQEAELAQESKVFFFFPFLLCHFLLLVTVS